MKNLTTKQAMVYKDLDTHNQYNWQGITKGQLLCIAQALASHHKAGGVIAYDCYRQITNYLYEFDGETYDYVVRANDLK
jgi:hypothetical protein